MNYSYSQGVWVVERSVNDGEWHPYLSFIHEVDAQYSLTHCQENRPGKFRLRKYVSE